MDANEIKNTTNDPSVNNVSTNNTSAPSTDTSNQNTSNSDIEFLKNQVEELKGLLNANKKQEDPISTPSKLIELEAKKAQEEAKKAIKREAEMGYKDKENISKLAEQISPEALELFKDFENKEYKNGYDMDIVNTNALTDIVSLFFKEIENLDYVPLIFKENVNEFMKKDIEDRRKEVKDLLPAINIAIELKGKEAVAIARNGGSSLGDNTNPLQALVNERNQRLKRGM